MIDISAALFNSNKPDFRHFCSQFPHQPAGLIAVQMCNTPDFFVGQPFLLPLGPLAQDAQDAGLGSFPVNPPVAFRGARFAQTGEYIRREYPVGAPTSTAAL